MDDPQVIRLAEAAGFALGGVTVTPAARTLAVGPREAVIEPRVMQVLVTLDRQRGEVVGREALIDACWGGQTVGEDAINRSILKLRRVLDEIGGDVTIETVPKVGYRLCVGETGSLADLPLRQASADGSRERIARWALPGVALVIAAVAALTLLAWSAWRPSARSSFAFAIRDFRVVGDKPDMGISLADRIAGAFYAHHLAVVSRTRSSHGDVDGARYIVGGEIARLGQSVRVDIRIDDARSGLGIWANSVIRPAAESDALEDQVASKLADLVDLTRHWLGPKADRVPPEAVGTLLEAVEAMRAGNAGRLEARAAFRRLRDLAPNFSAAHSHFAMATLLAADTQPPTIALQWRAQARAEAQQAISLDAKNPEGYLAMGLTSARDLAERQRWFTKGLVADPENATLCNYTGDLLLDVGRIAESLSWYDRARALDPASAPKIQSLIRALSVAGRFNEAAAFFPRVRRLWPDDDATSRAIVLSSLIYAVPKQAIEELARLQASARPMPADHAAAWRKYVAARTAVAGRLGAERRLAALIDTSSGWELDAVIAALASLGDADDAFRAIDVGHPRGWSTATLFEPASSPLRKDPRFGPLTRRLGLTRYWANTATRPDFCAGASPDRCGV